MALLQKETVKAPSQSPDHLQPLQWLQQMMGVMLMREMAHGTPLTPQPQAMHISEFPVTTAKQQASPSFITMTPSLQDWFKALNTIPSHKSSNALEFIPILKANDIEDLSNLVNFQAQELMDLTKMTIGFSKHLLHYAQEDLAITENSK